MSIGGHVGGQKSCPKGSGGFYVSCPWGSDWFYVGGAHGGSKELSMGCHVGGSEGLSMAVRWFHVGSVPRVGSQNVFRFMHALTKDRISCTSPPFHYFDHTINFQ